MTRVYIDGSSGTTGLRIRERLAAREDIALLELPAELRREESARREAMARADIVFLCLPDDAAREAARWPAGPETVVVDTSTAHRTAADWEYGFPELAGRRERIAKARRIANPGCHASGFIVLAEPLVRAGLIAPDAALTCFSLTGYSGGGKKMIAGYETAETPETYRAPRQYGLDQRHKHLPEMTAISGLTVPPVFCPVVDDYYSGMETVVALHRGQLRGTPEDIRALYRERYAGPLVRYAEMAGEDGMLSANVFSGRDDMEVAVAGNEERILLTARFDNLGKGASGAAIQNMNIVMGVPETTGLVWGGSL